MQVTESRSLNQRSGVREAAAAAKRALNCNGCPRYGRPLDGMSSFKERHRARAAIQNQFKDPTPNCWRAVRPMTVSVHGVGVKHQVGREVLHQNDELRNLRGAYRGG